MPDAPATNGKARSLLALAPNQPSLLASCRLHGFQLAFMPSCDRATAKTCLTNLTASSSSRPERTSLVTFQSSAIAERRGCEDWRKGPDANGCTTRQTRCDCCNSSRPWHALHVATAWVAVYIGEQVVHSSKVRNEHSNLFNTVMHQQSQFAMPLHGTNAHFILTLLCEPENLSSCVCIS